MVKLREIYSLSDSGWLNRGEVGFLGRQRGPGEAAGIEGKSRASLCEAVEGYTYELVLRERGLNLFPGDLFIKREKWSRL